MERDISAHIRDLIDEYPEDEGFSFIYDLMKIERKKFE